MPRSSCVASSTASVIWPSRAACVATISSISPLLLRRQLAVAHEQRLGSAVDGGHRRPQLVRDRGDEVALLLLEPPLARQVAERVDDPVRACGPRRTRATDRACRRATGSVARRAAAPCSATGIRATSASHSGKTSTTGTSQTCVAAHAGHERRGAVPEADDAFAVDEEDAVADGVEHVRGLLALGRDRARRRLGGLEPPLLLLQARVAHGRRHLLHEPVDELELVVRVLGAVAHHLDDADDAALVLDRHHHRRRAFPAAPTPAASATFPSRSTS